MRVYNAAKILVVDSGPALRGALACRLGAVGFHVVVTDHGAAVERLIQEFDPDIAVFEMTNERHDEITRAVRLLGAAKVIVAMDSSVPAERRACAMRAGAADVVIKPFDVDELLARIANVMSGFDDEAVLQFDDVTIDEVGHRVHRAGVELELTVTEFNLLVMFVHHVGRVLSKRQLLATIWGFDDYDVNLVEVHVCALRKKLEAHGPRIVQTVRGIGYVLRTASTTAVDELRAVGDERLTTVA